MTGPMHAVQFRTQTAKHDYNLQTQVLPNQMPFTHHSQSIPST